MIKRAVLGIVAGLLVWTLVATILNLGLRLGIDGYRAAETTFAFTLAMKIERLLLGAAASLAGGFVAAVLAREARSAPLILGVILLGLFIPVHAGLWDKFPIWYHFAFLGSLVPLSWLGGRLHFSRHDVDEQPLDGETSRPLRPGI